MRYKAFLVLCSLFLISCDDEPKTQAGKENTSENQKISTFTDRVDAEFKPLKKEKDDKPKKPMKYCDGKPLIIEMGEFIFQTYKRESVSIKFSDNSNKRNFHHQCDIDKVSDVISARWIGYQIATAEALPDIVKKKYQKHLNEVDHLDPIILENGTEKYQLLGKQIFVLPVREGRTFGNNPVTIQCRIKADQIIYSTTTCRSWSQVKEKIYIYYDFSREKNEEIEFLNFDKKMQSKFEEMLISE